MALVNLLSRRIRLNTGGITLCIRCCIGAYSKRSCFQVKMEKENVNEVQRRKSARLSKFSGSLKEDDQGAAEKSEEEEDKFTFINYKGDIKYFTDYYQIAMACDDITKWLDKQTDAKVVPVSFDMEWPFSFQTGPGKTSVIQICVEEDCCYVFQLTNIKKLPAALVGMLKHPKALMHGVNIKNDFRKLARDFPEVNADELINKSIDLGVWCNTVCETGGRWSLDRLAKFIVKKAVDKNKKVRMSKWHIVPLNETQLLYAAIDVYIGQLIYRELDKRAQAKEKNETDYKEQHGEEAFKALKSLGQNFITPPVALEETNKDTKSEANPDLLQ